MLKYSPAILLSASYAVYSFERYIPWHWFTKGHRGSIRNDRNYSFKFLLNTRTNVVHWPNSELFLNGTSIQKAQFEVLATTPEEMETQLRKLLAVDAILGPVKTGQDSEVIGNLASKPKDSVQANRFNRTQVGLTVEHVAVSFLYWEGNNLIGGSTAISLLTLAIMSGQKISRRQLDLLAKLEILTSNDQAKSFKLLRDHFTELQRSLPAIVRPDYLSSFGNFEEHWERVYSNIGIVRFRESLEKRQKVFKNSFEQWVVSKQRV